MNSSTTGLNYSYSHIQPAQGWQCPVCGNILSPWTMMCPCHGNSSNNTWNNWTVTNASMSKEDFEKSGEE